MMAVRPEHRALMDRYAAAVERRDGAGLRALLDDDFVEVYPQSGERMSGGDPSGAALERQPTAPRIIGDRHVTSVGDDHIVFEALVNYSGGRWWMVGLFRVHEDRFRRLTAYYGQPFDIPDWRGPLVDRYDPADPSAWEDHGDDQPVERETVEAFVVAAVANDVDRIKTFVHPDFRLLYPQSGEVMKLAQLISVDQQYPGGLPHQEVVDFAGGSERWIVTPTNIPQRVTGGGDVWVGEGLFDYPSGERFLVVDIVTFRDRLVWRERSYFCPPFEAAPFRSDLAERLDPESPLG